MGVVFPTRSPADSVRPAGRGRMGTMPAVILAHQGGWDELLMVAVPIMVVAVLLMVANRRARTALGEQAAPPADDDTT